MTSFSPLLSSYVSVLPSSCLVPLAAPEGGALWTQKSSHALLYNPTFSIGLRRLCCSTGARRTVPSRSASMAAPRERGTQRVMPCRFPHRESPG